jgi:hypothetical protein
MLPNDVLIAGPYIGDFQQEVTCFRPYIRYICETNEYRKIYICSHVNRSFLYDWSDYNIEFMPVYEHLSRDESRQTGYIHQDVSLRDFNLLVKTLKQLVLRKETGKTIRELDRFFLPYVKSLNVISHHQKVFTSINIPEVEIKEKDFILFIPDSSLQEDDCMLLYGMLKETFNNLIVVGDQKCNIPERNLLAKEATYFENGYRMLMNYISKASMVICPISHWTLICNLQGIPVFSWGEQPGQYKKDGIFGFNNNNTVIYADYKTKMESLVSHAKYFQSKLCKENVNNGTSTTSPGQPG